MSRSLLLSLLTSALLLAGLATVQGDIIALALPLVSYLLIGYLQAPDKVRMEATRQLSIERALPGQEVEVTVTITNQGPALEDVLLQDRVPAGLIVRSKTSRHLVRLASGESYAFSYTVSGPRGGYVFDGLLIQANDPLAVRSSKAQVEAKGRLFVLPRVTRLRQIAIRPRRTRVCRDHPCPCRVPLSPGMAVTVEIKTGKRGVIEYLLSPLLKSVQDSLRER